jgi:AcrR family transcriptional regulator
MRLTRRDVVATAMELIERDGAAAISMQRLATELGCGTLALYSLMPSRSDLLDAIATEIMSSVEVSAAAAAAADTAAAELDTWPSDLAAQVRAYREACRDYPQCALTVAGRPFASVAAARPAEHALATLAAAGLAGTEALRIGRMLAAYVVGMLLHEAGRDVPLEDKPPHSRDLRLRAADFPHLTALAGGLAKPDRDGDFEFGLGLLIQVIAAHADVHNDRAAARALRFAGATTPAPRAITSARTTGTASARCSPSALASPPISTGPPSMPA